MTNYADAVSDIEKIKAEGLKTDEEVRNWAMSHGYGPAQLDDVVAEWAKDAPEVEAVEDEIVEDEVVEDEVVDDVEDDVVEEPEDVPTPTKKSTFWKA